MWLSHHFRWLSYYTIWLTLFTEWDWWLERDLAISPWFLNPYLDSKKKDGLYSDRTHKGRCNRERFLLKEPISDDDDIHPSTFPVWQQLEKPFERGIDMQGFPGRSTRRIMGKIVFLGSSTRTAARSAGWRRRIRMCECPCFPIVWPYNFVFRSLVGMYLRKIGIDCNITLEE